MTPEQYALNHRGAEYSVSFHELKEFETSCGSGGTFEEEHLQGLKDLLGAEKFSIDVSYSGCRTCGGTDITIRYYGCTKL